MLIDVGGAWVEPLEVLGVTAGRRPSGPGEVIITLSGDNIIFTPTDSDESLAEAVDRVGALIAEAQHDAIYGRLNPDDEFDPALDGEDEDLD